MGFDPTSLADVLGVPEDKVTDVGVAMHNAGVPLDRVTLVFAALSAPDAAMQVRKLWAAADAERRT